MQSEYFAGGFGARQLRHMQGRVLCRSRVHSVGVAGSAAETSRRVSTFAFLPPWSLTQTTFSSILCSRSSTKGVSWTHTVSLMPFKNWELLLLWSWSSSLTARFKIQIHIILRSILCHAFFAGCCFGLGKKGAPLFLELWFKYTNAPKLQLKTWELIQSVNQANQWSL